MARVIHKYKVPPRQFPYSEIEVIMPAHAEIVAVGEQFNIPCVWAIHDPEQTDKERRHLYAVPTGTPILFDRVLYHGYCVIHERIVTHIVEKV